LDLALSSESAPNLSNLPSPDLLCLGMPIDVIYWEKSLFSGYLAVFQCPAACKFPVFDPSSYILTHNFRTILSFWEYDTLAERGQSVEHFEPIGAWNISWEGGVMGVEVPFLAFMVTCPNLALPYGLPSSLYSCQ